MLNHTTHIEIKWSTSRARDTYGYNICSLWEGGRKRGSCDGGGYDMVGTVLGDWLALRYADRLNALTIPMTRRNGEDAREYYGLTYHDPTFDPGKAQSEHAGTIEEAEDAGKSVGLERYQAFYKASSRFPTSRHTIPQIDGACGLESVKRIAEAIGVTIECTVYNKKLSTYTVTTSQEEDTTLGAMTEHIKGTP